MSKVKNPFTPAEQVQKGLKVLIYGESGSGKTWLALTFPGPLAVIDTEGGTELYGGRDDIQPFDVLRSKSYDEIMKALDFIAASGQYVTVVVDPITVIWQVLQEAAIIKNERKAIRENRQYDGSLTYRDWGVIKNRINALFVRLTNMPCHVVVTARQKDEYTTKGTELIKLGVKPDSEKSTPYQFDIVLRTVKSDKGYHAIAEKDRSGQLQNIVDGPAFATMEGVADRYSAGALIERQTEEDAASAEADNMLAEEDQEARKPVSVQPKFKRPMAPDTLQKFLAKRLKEVVAEGYSVEDLCAEETAQGLGKDWAVKLADSEPYRHTVVSYLVKDDIESFFDLSHAEAHVLRLWLDTDTELCHAEVAAILEMLGEQPVPDEPTTD